MSLKRIYNFVLHISQENNTNSYARCNIIIVELNLLIYNIKIYPQERLLEVSFRFVRVYFNINSFIIVGMILEINFT